MQNRTRVSWGADMIAIASPTSCRCFLPRASSFDSGFSISSKDLNNNSKRANVSNLSYLKRECRIHSKLSGHHIIIRIEKNRWHAVKTELTYNLLSFFSSSFSFLLLFTSLGSLLFAVFSVILGAFSFICSCEEVVVLPLSTSGRAMVSMWDSPF